MKPLLDRHYRAALDIALACGLPLSHLENYCRPAAWGAPRDFWWSGHAMFYADESLGELETALFARGETDAAIKLRDFRARIAKERVICDEALVGDPADHVGVLVPVQRELVERSEDELQRGLARRAHPSDTETARYDWENE